MLVVAMKSLLLCGSPNYRFPFVVCMVIVTVSNKVTSIVLVIGLHNQLSMEHKTVHI